MATRRSRMRSPRRQLVHLAIVSALATAGALVAVPAADARITKVQITTTQSPTFGGYSWPGVGQYEKIVGKAFGRWTPPIRRTR